jgi:hypothetical protein
MRAIASACQTSRSSPPRGCWPAVVMAGTFYQPGFAALTRCSACVYSSPDRPRVDRSGCRRRPRTARMAG